MKRVTKTKTALTAELSGLLRRYEGVPFGKCEAAIRRDCEDFLVQSGIQRGLMPEIYIWIDEGGYINIEMGSYPSPTLITCN